ncbi:MAG: transposase [Verrucomicrobiota bacterium]
MQIQQWNLLHCRGKKNSAAERISDNIFDAQDPRNEGIIQDVYIGAGGQQMRRIVYQDPRDGKIYTYITNELTLPAFALVRIYKHRWDIEKVFYQLKSKFNERKCWASSLVGKEAQAIFECLAHNLCLLIENQIITEENMQDEVEEGKKRAGAKIEAIAMEKK